MDGATLRRERVRLGLTQVELADLLDLPQNTISRWEIGTSAIQHGVLLERAMRDVARELEQHAVLG